MAWKQGFALVAFRGTEADSIHDIVTDAQFAFTDWDNLDEQVHKGFRDALDLVWPQLMTAIKPLGRSSCLVYRA